MQLVPPSVTGPVPAPISTTPPAGQALQAALPLFAAYLPIGQNSQFVVELGENIPASHIVQFVPPTVTAHVGSHR